MLTLTVAMAMAMTQGSFLAPQVTADDPRTVSDALQLAGYAPEMGEADSGDPEITGDMDGTTFTVGFLGCVEHKDCTTVQLYSGFTGKLSLEQVNQWNWKRRFARVYVTEDTTWIEYDIDLDEGGMSAALFQDNLAVFASLQNQLQAYILGDIQLD